MGNAGHHLVTGKRDDAAVAFSFSANLRSNRAKQRRKKYSTTARNTKPMQDTIQILEKKSIVLEMLFFGMSIYFLTCIWLIPWLMGDISKAELMILASERNVVTSRATLPGMASTGMTNEVQLTATKRPDGR